MKLVTSSVKRPVGVIMIVLAIIALGVVSLRNLNVNLMPEIDLPVAVVATSYGDAAPEEVEKLISEPIESSVSSVEGIETVQSQSQAGSSLVVLMFNSGTNLDQALLNVRESVDQVRGVLPENAGDPSILRFNPQQMPIMWVGLTGDEPAKLTQVANDEIVPYFERQSGVASVTVEGAKKREIQLILDQAKLNQYGVTSRSIIEALNNANQSASVGTIEKGNKDLQLRVTGELASVDDIKETIVQTERQATVHVSDLADVRDTYKESDSKTIVNGESAVVLSIMKKTDANTVNVANNVNASMTDMKNDLPAELQTDVIIDTSEYIKMSIQSVVQNIIIGGIISFFILLLFLKSIRATIVIGLSIPIAIISTFTLMYFTGETLNVLTLGGLALGLGMMVDSSIVILEHIYSYRQHGYAMVDAAIKGASELASAVIASTTTTLVVFLPMVFVEGIASDMFTPLALAVSFSLIASLVAAVTLVPMLSSKLLAKATGDSGRRYWFNRFLDKVNNVYRSMLRWVLGHRKTTVFGTVVIIAGSLALIPQIGTSFMPSTDQGKVQVNVQTGPGSSFAHTTDITETVSDKLDTYDAVVETNYLNAGGGGGAMGMGGSSGGSATYRIQLVPAAERDASTSAIVQDMSDDLETVPGAEISVSASNSAAGMGDPIQLSLNGPEHQVLRDLADDVVNTISRIDGVRNAESSAGTGVPQMQIEVDNGKAAQYGLTKQQIISQIRLQFTGRVASTYREDGDEMNVTLMFPKEERSTISDLEDMSIHSPSGATIPLVSLADLNEAQGPVTLQRENQEPQVNITSELAGRNLGRVSSDVEQALDDMAMPDGYTYDMGGQVEDMAESFGQLAVALVFSIFLVYAVMAVQFENALFPFVIMFSLPATVIGVLGGLYVTGLPLSIPAFIGVIMLAGIVVNNSIVLVDYINIVRRKGSDRHEAILEAGPSRLRPILMTTLTTILAMVPLGLALGQGSAMQQPLAITIIFGLSVSSIFTLLLIPVVYTLFDDLTAKFTRR
ncbi:efflux RND transporter permease subunit [Lentibacillus halophilus]|uniref:Efflux RND transporter permease subunit n=1 Tax=Lentibacillus halophilus TaxID=295065 RepID=A0ABP3J0P4_9BACI